MKYLSVVFVLFLLFSLVPPANAQTCPVLPTNTGTDTLSVTIPSTGTYKVWSRIKPSATDANANSFWLQFGTQCGMKIGDNSSAIPANTWTWVDFQNGDTAQKVTTTFSSSGTQVLKLTGNEANVGVDKIVILDSTNTCIPTGLGDNCAAVATATLTGTAPTSPLTPIPSGTGSTVSLTPTADAYVDANTPSVNHGTATSLIVNDVPLTISYLRFDLSSLTGKTILGAKLRLFITNASANRQFLKFVDTNWSESTVTYGTKPSLLSSIATIDTGTSAGQYKEIDITSAVTSTQGQEISLGLENDGDDDLQFNSRENTSNKPQLVVTIAGALETPIPTPTRTPTPIATSTPQPTATPVPNSIRAAVTLLLHGIGKGGDNVSPGTLGNQTPLTPQRTVTLQFINSQNVVVAQPSGLLTYASTTGDFRGVIDAGTVLPSGTYQIRVKTPIYLSSQIGSFFTLTQGQTTTLPSATLVVGDSNNDNLLNILDYNLLLDCYSVFEPARSCSDPQKQKSADLNDDGKVNTTDTTLWQRELSVQSGK